MKNLKAFKTKLPFLFLLFCIANSFGILRIAAEDTSLQFIKGSDTLVVYKDVPGLTPSEFYRIRVRSAATNYQWIDCFANITRSLHSMLPQDAKTNNNTKEHYYNYIKDWSHTYANIEMSRGEQVEVEISLRNGFKIKGKDAEFAAVHPAQKAGKPIVKGNKVYFTIENPAQITIDINGQMDETNTGNGYSGPPVHTVSLFSNPVIKKPSINDPNVFVVEPGIKPPSDLGNKTILYFKPGVHDIGRGFKVHSNQEYYIPGDAIVYGSFNNIGVGTVENVKIFGYGSLCGDRLKHPYYDPEFKGDNRGWKTIYTDNCTNFRVEGISIVNPPFHTINLNSAKSSIKQTFCRWVKIVTWRCNGDGIGTAHEVSDCFIRTQDDCCYVKGDRKRCVFWTDVNGSVFVLAGMPTERAMVVEDCDVIYPRHCSTKWNGGRVFSKRGKQQAAPGTTKVNVLFKDIRISDKFQTLETFNLRSFEKEGNSGGYSGITFKNITSVKTPSDGDNVIMGHSGGPWSDITFDNVVLGQKRIANVKDLHINEFVTNLTFINDSTLKK